ncbi:hypothetical protein D3C71_1205680 [compost metagenome]
MASEGALVAAAGLGLGDSVATGAGVGAVMGGTGAATAWGAVALHPANVMAAASNITHTGKSRARMLVGWTGRQLGSMR